ncbi:hypothetical protein MSG28_001025 [Choristoneura fumiferana]|uniref:Uncharacterized protein n=1 Tax=Choristoneura fumiferana TaxID=7141 RepID=A0ACC0K3T7_CHOFU|nr:hypothetical protein MSG28_001025 [Choristoneura fumiferana]
MFGIVKWDKDKETSLRVCMQSYFMFEPAPVATTTLNPIEDTLPCAREDVAYVDQSVFMNVRAAATFMLSGRMTATNHSDFHQHYHKTNLNRMLK